jgi:hypothetical protein
VPGWPRATEKLSRPEARAGRLPPAQQLGEVAADQGRVAFGLRAPDDADDRDVKSPYLKSSLASLYCDDGNLYHVNADLSICGVPPSGLLQC